MGSPINHNETNDTPTVLLRRLHHWRMAFFGIVILLAGVLGGAATTLLLVGHARSPYPPFPDDRALFGPLSGPLRGPLHLTAEQEAQVEPILRRHMTRLAQIRQDGQKAIVEDLKLLNQEMAGVLTEDQMRLWEQLFLDLPGPIRHIPRELGPGVGRGPAPGPGGWKGPPGGRPGPFHVPSTRPPAPDTNAVPHR